MRVPFITKVGGLNSSQLEACRPFDQHELRSIFRDRWLAAHPDLNESDILRIQAEGLRLRDSWAHQFKLIDLRKHRDAA